MNTFETIRRTAWSALTSSRNRAQQEERRCRSIADAYGPTARDAVLLLADAHASAGAAYEAALAQLEKLS